MGGRQVITREWEAPLALVWELWTTPVGLCSWWGPRGFTCDVATLDVRVGGTFAYTMRASDPEMVARMEASGRPTAHAVEATFTEVSPPHRLAWQAPWGAEMLCTTATFTEVEGRVRLELVLEATMPQMLDGASMGWQQSLDRLGERLAV